MPTSDIHQKISLVETALKDAGPNQAINAIVDVLKEIAKTLENQDKPASKGPLPAPTIPSVPEHHGRKFRTD